MENKFYSLLCTGWVYEISKEKTFHHGKWIQELIETALMQGLKIWMTIYGFRRRWSSYKQEFARIFAEISKYVSGRRIYILFSRSWR